MNKLTYRVITSFAVAAIILLALGGVAAPVQAGGGAYVIPISPNGATEYTSPTFVWYTYPSAVQYTVAVYTLKGSRLVLDQPVYSYNCGSTYCRYTTSKKLAVGAGYYWHVTAWLLDGAEVSSANYLIFTVYQPFSSSFMNSKGWTPLSGTWHTMNGLYIGMGNVSQWDTAYYSKGQYDTFTYEVRLMRTSSTHPSAIFFNGVPSPLNYEDDWNNCYFFDFDTSGYYSVWAMVNGGEVNIIPWTLDTTLINPTWNILTITYNSSTGFAQFFINHVLVGSGTLSIFTHGYVGVGFYSDVSTVSLNVDYANLTAGAPEKLVGSAVQKSAHYVTFDDRNALPATGSPATGASLP
ncbi:MAG: hypothetical protein WCE68_11225 [Anaerolineales bacterium]